MRILVLLVGLIAAVAATPANAQVKLQGVYVTIDRMVSEHGYCSIFTTIENNTYEYLNRIVITLKGLDENGNAIFSNDQVISNVKPDGKTYKKFLAIGSCMNIVEGKVASRQCTMDNADVADWRCGSMAVGRKDGMRPVSALR